MRKELFLKTKWTKPKQKAFVEKTDFDVHPSAEPPYLKSSLIQTPAHQSVCEILKVVAILGR